MFRNAKLASHSPDQGSILFFFFSELETSASYTLAELKAYLNQMCRKPLSHLKISHPGIAFLKQSLFNLFHSLQVLPPKILCRFAFDNLQKGTKMDSFRAQENEVVW